MVVITLTDCPQKIRGDLTKWMLEISTGVYVGNFSTRVRKGLWKRICDNIKNGRAVMIYSTNGEQHFGFEVHNSRWVPEDFDGVKLIRHLSEEKQPSGKDYISEFSPFNVRSKAAAMRVAVVNNRKGIKISSISKYTVLDIETTGIDAGKEQIIEIGALQIEDGKILKVLNHLISQEKQLPAEIVRLTGITDEMLRTSGRALTDVLTELYGFIGDDIIVCHNCAFDKGFLEVAFESINIPKPDNTYLDTMEIARKKLRNVRNNKLKTLADYLGVEYEVMHRAVPDCRITFNVFEKLKNF